MSRAAAPPIDIRAAARWLGAAAILTAFFIRASTTFVTLPWWALDATIAWTDETGLLPSSGFMLDAIVSLGAALCILGAPRRPSQDAPAFVLVLIGLLWAALHGLILPSGAGLRGGLPALMLGSAWTAAAMGGFGLFAAARDPALRAAAAGLMLGFIAVLLTKGAYQAAVELPELIREFDRSPEALLGPQAMEAGSAAARMLERRLRQPDATGWFALSNVYGSVCGATAAALLALSLSAWRAGRARVPSGWAGLLTLALFGACAALMLSASKGAVVAAAIAGAIVTAIVFVPRAAGVARRAGGWILISLAAAALAGIVVRGLIGERIGELSLLFRWHYMAAAARVITEHPLLGAGPAGFQDAYLLARLPVSPEEVESPHSVFLDLIARLGLGGAAWAALLLAAMWRIRAAGEPDARAGAARNGGDALRGVPYATGRMAVFVPLLATAASLWTERAMLGPDVIMLRVTVIGVWIAVAFGVARIASVVGSALSAALFGAAAALIVHAQIEMTPVIPGSCGLFAAMIGLACAAGGTATDAPPRHARAEPHRRSWSMGLAIAGLVAAAWSAVVIVAGSIPAARWESELHAGAEAARPLAEVRALLARAMEQAQAGAGGTAPRAGPARPADEAIARLSGELGRRVERDAESLGEAMFALQRRVIADVTSRLEAADRLAPSEPGALARAVRLWMDHAAACRATGGESEARTCEGRAIAAAERLRDRFPDRAGSWARLGAVLEAVGRAHGDDAATLARAAACWERAAALDPHGLAPLTRLARLWSALGDARAAGAARRVLMLNEQKRLDPLRQLGPAELNEFERIARGDEG